MGHDGSPIRGALQSNIKMANFTQNKKKRHSPRPLLDLLWLVLEESGKPCVILGKGKNKNHNVVSLALRMDL